MFIIPWHGEESVMFFVLISFVSKVIVADGSDFRDYERESAISPECKESDWQEQMSGGICAAAAASEKIYKFGFVVHERICVTCRAAGTPGDTDALEIPSSGHVYVDGKASKSHGCISRKLRHIRSRDRYY